MDVKSFGAVCEHPRGRPLPWPKLDFAQRPLRIARQLAKTATMALGMNCSGKNFHPGNPNFLQLGFTATCSQFSGIDARCGCSLSNTAAFVIAGRERFACPLIQPKPQAFFHVISW